MLPSRTHSEYEENLLLLNFAARVLTASTNREILLNIAVEHLADFAHSERAGILTLDSGGEMLCFENVFTDKKVMSAKGEIALDGSPLADVLSSKNTAVYPLASATPLPLPSFSAEEQSASRCLCLPMVSPDLRSVGVVTVEINREEQLKFEILQNLRILTTILTISLQHAALFEQALKDGLTGVYVRKYGETRLTEELARVRRYSGSVGIIFLDIDHFKDINDSLGHLFGDQVLREFAGLIEACLRQDIDLVSRYGGDEFVVMIPNATPDEVGEIAERIRFECLKRFSLEPFDKLPATVGVTGGVAVADHQTPLSPEELLMRADKMLYRAKQAGRNRIEVWRGD